MPEVAPTQNQELSTEVVVDARTGESVKWVKGGLPSSTKVKEPTGDEVIILPLIDPDKLEWKEEGLCNQTDPEAFFPEKGGSTREAKRVCSKCTVREICLEHALNTDERFGIWGGKSERERRKIKKKREAEKEA